MAPVSREKLYKRGPRNTRLNEAGRGCGSNGIPMFWKKSEPSEIVAVHPRYVAIIPHSDGKYQVMVKVPSHDRWHVAMTGDRTDVFNAIDADLMKDLIVRNGYVEGTGYNCFPIYK